ncbi:MAG: hypothetical protein MI920_15985 [Kiloniellales bacterium]|nr:hypothetical protein [Kiloniellales bacterium]
MLPSGNSVTGHQGLARRTGSRGRRKATFLSLLTLLVAGLAPAAQAFMPDMSVVRNAEIVPDEELADMRGRFVQGGDVTYFGLQMITAWQTADGTIINTGVEWGMDVANSAANPTVSFFHLSTEEPNTVNVGQEQLGLSGPEPLPLAPTAGAGGLETATGVVQSIQAAGDLNDIGNDLAIAIVDSGAVATLANPQASLGAPTEITETTTQQLSSTVRATAFIEDNAIGMVVDVQGGGRVLQELRGDLGRAAQHVNVTSNLNVIRNAFQINFGVSQANQPLAANVGSALRLLQGLRQ